MMSVCVKLNEGGIKAQFDAAFRHDGEASRFYSGQRKKSVSRHAGSTSRPLKGTVFLPSVTPLSGLIATIITGVLNVK